MNKAMAARLDKLEGATDGGALAIVWVDPGREDEAEVEAARLETQGRRPVLVGWETERVG